MSSVTAGMIMARDQVNKAVIMDARLGPSFQYTLSDANQIAHLCTEILTLIAPIRSRMMARVELFSTDQPPTKRRRSVSPIRSTCPTHGSDNSRCNLMCCMDQIKSGSLKHFPVVPKIALHLITSPEAWTKSNKLTSCAKCKTMKVKCDRVLHRADEFLRAQTTERIEELRKTLPSLSELGVVEMSDDDTEVL